MTRFEVRACLLILGLALSGCGSQYGTPAFPNAVRVDPFILAIADMKHSVAPIVCLAGNDGQVSVIETEGSAFFISAAGGFLTAAHVLEDMRKHSHPCPILAIYLPSSGWRSDTVVETFVWFPFTVSACILQRDFDIAKCSTREDLTQQRPGFSFTIRPARLEFSDPAEGTEVAFTGFPLGLRDPLTSRAGIAAYRTSPETAQMVLDQTTWPGASGSPVYLSDGRVIGIMSARGIAESSGISIVTPARLVRSLLQPAPAR